MRRALLVLLATFASGASLVPADAFAGPHRDAVLDLLNAYEGTASAAELKALGEGVDRELMEIADDGTVPSSRRGRAVTALAFFPTDPVRVFLEGHLSADSKSLIRRKAAYALADGWGDKSVPALAKALSDADVQVRIAAASALGRVDGDAAKDALRARLLAEKEPAVRGAIESSLGGAR